jgi:hypothetical protein
VAADKSQLECVVGEKDDHGRRNRSFNRQNKRKDGRQEGVETKP